MIALIIQVIPRRSITDGTEVTMQLEDGTPLEDYLGSLGPGEEIVLEVADLQGKVTALEATIPVLTEGDETVGGLITGMQSQLTTLAAANQSTAAELGSVSGDVQDLASELNTLRATVLDQADAIADMQTALGTMLDRLNGMVDEVDDALGTRLSAALTP